ncbi:SDR family oxidoreductase [Novosphingobium sp.]|uniref:SDR family oxidoreductase n=1 Tax=Novosphingobium sp. TaxID=1874826 RepID=UPI0031DF812E
MRIPHYKNEDASSYIKARYGDQLWFATLDLTDTHAIRGVVDRAWSALGRIDVLVSNAGYGLMGAAEEVTDDQLRHQIETNLVGSIQVIRAALPHFRAQNGGRILQVSSMGGQVAFPGGSLYHATKWGIEGFVEAVAQEVAVFGIGCTIVEPGGARTDFRHRSAAVGPMNPAYDVSPSRMVNRVLNDESIKSPGDPAKMVDAMIASVAQEPAPLRLALGSDAYALAKKAYAARAEALEAQRKLACSTDVAEEDAGTPWYEQQEA